MLEASFLEIVKADTAVKAGTGISTYELRIILEKENSIQKLKVAG